MDMSKLDPEIRKAIEDGVRFDSGFKESHSLSYTNTVFTTCLLKQSYKDAFKNIKQKEIENMIDVKEVITHKFVGEVIDSVTFEDNAIIIKLEDDSALKLQAVNSSDQQAILECNVSYTANIKGNITK